MYRVETQNLSLYMVLVNPFNLSVHLQQQIMQELRKITRSNDALFGAAMEIYLQSFPANERQSAETIKGRLDKGLYILYAACERDEVLAMLLLYPLEGAAFMVIDYLAVNDQHRKKGVGGWLMREVMATAKLEYDSKYLVLESEDPAYGGNKIERVARVNFYKKLGARIMEGVYYILPAMAGEMPTEMVLMLLPGYEGDSLPGAMVKNMIEQMYLQLYGRGKDDELLLSFLNQVPETVRLV